MKIRANSRESEVAENTTVADFIASTGLNPSRCVVELNGLAMRFAEFKDVILKEGDRLEVMRVVAGG